MNNGGQTPLLYDWSGAPVTASAAPITGRPGQALNTTAQGGMVALFADSTGTARVPRVDTNGNLGVTSTAQIQAGSSPTGAGIAGPLVLGLSSGVARVVQLDALQNLLVMQNQLPTFTSVAAGVAINTGKSIFALVNGSTAGMVLRLVAVYVVNSSTTTAALGNTYNIYAAEIRPITGVSSGTGTAATILPHDSADALDANVKAWTGATVTGDTQGAYRRWITSNYGLTTNAVDSEAIASEQQGKEPWLYDFGGTAKGIAIRPGAGVHVKIASTATVGYLDITCVFTQASA